MSAGKKKPRSLRQQQHGATSKKSQRQYSRKSTSGAAQRQRILEALRVGPKTSFDLRKLGVYQHSVRIFELREAGFDIETARVTIVDHDGFEHRGCALYALTGEPVDGGAA
ncbi:helix-turn-helix domain-containing protein [Hydrogenophaga sp. NFH-34]|uniref:helix-turn-helix domain-containing protein n=1 Tax=Hydrogenophaga sp. NFH-34 TaxID=2744446 RepID=UPI001F46E8BF|nr:helix-turn-helix domain-containing protein [Hydrogenophaga sp. NFH-34]